MRGYTSYQGVLGMIELGKQLRSFLADALQRMLSDDVELTNPASILDRREDPLLAVDFAVDYAGHDCQLFLQLWREGDWETLRDAFPAWVSFMGTKGIDVFFEPRLLEPVHRSF
jgi:hypothetical protein